MNEAPFHRFDKVWVVAPSDFSSLSAVEAQQAGDAQKLIEENKRAIERELGCALEFVLEPPPGGALWLIGPRHYHPLLKKLTQSPEPTGPELTLDRERGLLISDGRTAEEVMETFSYLRSLSRFPGGHWKIENCTTTEEAVERIYNEVRCSYPSFALRNLDWDALTERSRSRIQKAQDPLPEMQKWLAQLEDAHTWVRPVPPPGNFPYDLIVEEGVARFYQVPEDSLAWSLGVRPGFELKVQDFEQWPERTGATPHSKPFAIGSRLLATKMGELRKFVALSPDKKVVEWEEKPSAQRWDSLVNWRKLPSGNGYLQIRLFLLGKGIEEAVDEAFAAFSDSPQLIVDLRGNPGGNILMAQRIRNRFLADDGPVGWIQNTAPDGRLNEREPIHATAAPVAKRWLKPTVFLTDPLTYSAAEDFLLGLQGRPHVKVMGQPSGGGSGRVRLIKLLEGWRLTISTALTYDLAGNCVEGSGIPVDAVFPISFDRHSLIKEADRLTRAPGQE